MGKGSGEGGGEYGSIPSSWDDVFYRRKRTCVLNPQSVKHPL